MLNVIWFFCSFQSNLSSLDKKREETFLSQTVHFRRSRSTFKGAWWDSDSIGFLHPLGSCVGHNQEVLHLIKYHLVAIMKYHLTIFYQVQPSRGQVLELHWLPLNRTLTWVLVLRLLFTRWPEFDSVQRHKVALLPVVDSRQQLKFPNSSQSSPLLLNFNEKCSVRVARPLGIRNGLEIPCPLV